MLIKRKTSPNWYVVFRDGPKRLKWISTKTTNKKDAQAFHNLVISEFKKKKDGERIRRLLNIPQEKHIEKITLANAWKVAIKIIPTIPLDTFDTYTRFKNWIEYNRPEVKYVDEVTTAIAHDYFYKKYSKNAPKTHNTYKSALHKMFKAYEIYDIPNPFSGIPNRDGGVQTKYRAFSDDELRAFIAALPSEWRDFARFTYYTGFRHIDAAHIMWNEIDFERNLIVTMPRKTKRFNRSVCVHLHPVLVDMLSELSKNRGESPYIFREAMKMHENDTFRRMIKNTLLEANVLDNARGKASFHSLRVTFITNCRKQGIDTKVIGGIVGHSDVKTTENYFDDMESGAVIKTLFKLC